MDQIIKSVRDSLAGHFLDFNIFIFCRVLKPYIRRDYETKPARLKLLEEIVAHSHK